MTKAHYFIGGHKKPFMKISYLIDGHKKPFIDANHDGYGSNVQ